MQRERKLNDCVAFGRFSQPPEGAHAFAKNPNHGLLPKRKLAASVLLIAPRSDGVAATLGSRVRVKNDKPKPQPTESKIGREGAAYGYQADAQQPMSIE